MGSNPRFRRKPGHGDRLRSGRQPGLPKIHPPFRPYSRAVRTFTPPHPRTGQTLLLPGGGHQSIGTTNEKFTTAGSPNRWWSDSIPQGKDWRTSPWFGTFAGNRESSGSTTPSWAGPTPTRRFGRLVALDEGSSLALDPTGRLPLPLETPNRLLALPARLSKRTTGLLRVEGVRPRQAPLDLTTSHEKQQFTRFYRLLQGGLCMASACSFSRDFRPTGSNCPAERFQLASPRPGSRSPTNGNAQPPPPTGTSRTCDGRDALR